MSNIIEIKKTPNQAVIEHLESLLVWAKASDIVGIAIAMRYEDGSTGNSFVQGPAGIALIGELELLKVEMMQGYLR